MTISKFVFFFADLRIYFPVFHHPLPVSCNTLHIRSNGFPVFRDALHIRSNSLHVFCDVLHIRSNDFLVFCVALHICSNGFLVFCDAFHICSNGLHVFRDVLHIRNNGLSVFCDAFHIRQKPAGGRRYIPCGFAIEGTCGNQHCGASAAPACHSLWVTMKNRPEAGVTSLAPSRLKEPAGISIAEHLRHRRAILFCLEKFPRGRSRQAKCY